MARTLFCNAPQIRCVQVPHRRVFWCGLVPHCHGFASALKIVLRRQVFHTTAFAKLAQSCAAFFAKIVFYAVNVVARGAFRLNLRAAFGAKVRFGRDCCAAVGAVVAHRFVD